MVILAILHVIKSTAYKRQIYGFRVFRQSLKISVISRKCKYTKMSQCFKEYKNADIREILENFDVANKFQVYDSYLYFD
jgi:hypothetical protein